MVCPQWCEAFYSAIPEVRGGGLSHARKCMEVPNVPKQNSMKCINRYWWILHDISVCVYTHTHICTQYTCNSILCDRNHLGHLLCCCQSLPSCCWDPGALLPILFAESNLRGLCRTSIVPDFRLASTVRRPGSHCCERTVYRGIISTPEVFWNTEAQMSANAYIHETQ